MTTFKSEQELEKQISVQQAEIDHLRQVVQGYEKGKAMRLLNLANRSSQLVLNKLNQGLKTVNKTAKKALVPAKPLRLDLPTVPPKFEIDPKNPPASTVLSTMVKSFNYWYQSIDFGNGILSAPRPIHHVEVWQHLERVLPLDLKGATVLEPGCNAGFYLMEMKKRGAGWSVGIDFSDAALQEAQFSRDVLGFKDIEYYKADLDRLSQFSAKFDIIMMVGILYHLKNPIQVLELASALCNDAIVIETEVITADPRNVVYTSAGSPIQVAGCTTGIAKFWESNGLNNDPTNWWVPDEACVMGMLRTAGFKYFSKPFYPVPTRLVVVASKIPDSILQLDKL